ncbi:hypothetical protein Leryth_021727 [Lithospermum erythrorhizon]|nr:hypothetical protein Leryth_021727 [Lithospermum erythrorhizon]
MISSFNKMDEEVNENGGSAVAMMGSTAVVAVVGEAELVVANCGDSRAVLCQDGAAIALSDDPKPDRADELERIEVCGGKVVNWNGQRVFRVLATSRSIGDQYLRPFVISEPEVRVMKRSDKDEFLILGSDGLWEVVANDLAGEIVKRCLDGHKRRASKKKDENNSCVSNKNPETGVALAAALLAELAIARGSRDNISVIVVELKR